MPSLSRSALGRAIVSIVSFALIISLISAFLMTALQSPPAPGPAPRSQEETGLISGSSTGSSPIASSPTGVEGWVRDDTTAARIAGAAISVGGRQLALSVGDGHFTIPAAELAPPGTTAPQLITISVAGPAHAAWTLRNVRYFPGDTLRVYPRLRAGDGRAVDQYAAAGALARPASLPGAAGGGELLAPMAIGLGAPPATLRVYRTSTGVVEIVPFRDYVKHVLPNEWVPSWSPEAVKAGAMAVKTYAWYWISRGGKQVALGADLKDNTDDQVYDPNVSYASTDAAVDATFNYMMTRRGELFEAQYCAGSYKADPTGDCPWPGPYITQWGSSYFADQGKSWGWILGFYYRGATINPAPPGGIYDGSGPPPGPPNAPPTRAPEPPSPPASYEVGQGSNFPELFQEAYQRNGGRDVLGRPVGPVRWWMQYVSEANVLSQRFSGAGGRSDVWLIYDVLKRGSTADERVFVITGEIALAYAAHNPPGPEWIGPPTSDPYVAAPAAGGMVSQGFYRGTLRWDGNGVRYVPWPESFSGWKAEYFPGKPAPEAGATPERSIAGDPALVEELQGVDLSWQAQPSDTAARGAGTGRWAAQFSREVSLEAGNYEFTLSADGPARLWVDGVLALDGIAWSGGVSETYRAGLSAGAHSLRLHYFKAGPGASLSLRMQRPGDKPPEPQGGPAPIPGIAPPGGTLRLAVHWLGAGSAPGPGWARPVTLFLSDTGSATVLYSFTGRTDDQGRIEFSGLPTGKFHVHLKGPHSLQSARANIDLRPAAVLDLDMRAQIEGDVDGDNCVTVDDFTIVQSMLGAGRDTPGFDARADLDADGTVTMLDVSLLRSGFDMCGDVSADEAFSAMGLAGHPSLGAFLAPWTDPQRLQGGLTMAVTGPGAARVGDTVEVAVIANTGSQQVDGASFVLRFDPAVVAPVDQSGEPASSAEPGLELPGVMGNWVDAKGGAAGYHAGVLQGTPPADQLLVATLRFKVAAAPAGGALIYLDPPSSKRTTLTNGGTNLLGTVQGLTISILP